ncbi:MAG: IS1634 family transposase [Acidobacteriota bacterium]
MFFRVKKSGPRQYLQIVENRWEQGGSRQRVIATLGRMDELREDGSLDGLLRSGSKFSETMMVISSHERGESLEVGTHRIGPGLVFERLWRETGCREVMEKLLSGRRFDFPVERAIFLTVLHRLFDPGSDRQADRWREEYRIEGVNDLQLHHLYRAMAWLGEELPTGEQCSMSRFAPRSTKDLIEEELFARRRDLFSGLELVFFDTTSIYFEGNGGQTVGEWGNSKDNRPDLRQMVVGAVLDQEGNPVCCEMWPGNATDVKSLLPVVDRLRKRFGIGQVCIVADRGMISRETLMELDSPERGWKYILGARMRSQKEVREEVLSVAGRYRVVHPKSPIRKEPSPLKVKDVVIDGRRYVVCVNEDQAQKDRADREAILSSLREQLKKGDKALVGNKGYRRYLKTTGQRFEIDESKVLAEARYDGKWVLRTNTDLPTDEVALKYKQLWMVESLFRTLKSILETRPIYHKRDETILGHVFCSFLSFFLMKELQSRAERLGYVLEWADVIRDLNRLQETELEQDGKRFLLRTEATGTTGKVFQAAGVAMPPTVRQTA